MGPHFKGPDRPAGLPGKPGSLQTPAQVATITGWGRGTSFALSGAIVSPNHRRILFALFFFAGLVQFAPGAEAQQRVRGRQATPQRATAARAAVRTTTTTTVRTARTTLRAEAVHHRTSSQKNFHDVLKASGSKFFTREVGGAKRIIANVSGQEALNSASKTMGKGSDVLQILHIGRNNISHTMAMFDGQLVHTQHVGGTQNWRLRNWGDMLRNSNTKMYSAFISLSPAEATKLRSTLTQAQKDQGPENLAGANWGNGKLKNTSLGGCRSFDCATAWTDMPLGKGGETLGEIVGFGNSYSRHPRTLQKNLETGGNDRIIGVAVYGPRIENFGANPAQGVVEF